MAFGVDVSQYNSVSDWKAVKQSGHDFAIIKITKKGNSKEPMFEIHYAGAKAAGLDVGAYRYVYAKNTAQAKEEAEAIVSVLNGRELPIGLWLDMEDSSIKGLGKSALNDIINTEAAIIRAAGYPVGIYCNRDWYKNVLDSASLVKSFIFWVAGYGKNTGTFSEASAATYKALGNCYAWQFTSKGTVPGIKGSVDRNFSFVDLKWLMATYGGAASKSSTTYPKYNGMSYSIIEVLRSVGETDTSFVHRKQIATANGIIGYTGTVLQNLSLVYLAKNGTLIKA